MYNLTIRRIDCIYSNELIHGIVKVFRDDEVVPWHNYDTCLAWVSKRIERGFYITGAYLGDEIVGYIEWIVTYDKGRELLYLGLMQVDCSLRGKGIGGAMLADGAIYAKSIGATYLRTIPEDERAYDFYKKYGFYKTDSIYCCTCPTVFKAAEKNRAAITELTLDIANTHEFVFGLCQSSGRHMYEVANHNPEAGEFILITAAISGGYLQFRYRDETGAATVLYWSNEEVTADTLSNILACGLEAGFKEISFYFKSKYLKLFIGFDVASENTEIEKKLI